MKVFMRENKVDVLAITEHRVTESGAVAIVSKLFLGWNWFSNASPSNKGRIWLVWNPNTIMVQVLVSHAQFIHSFLKCCTSSLSFHFSVVYGKHTIADRCEMWSELGDISSSQHGPWLIMGDFNSILNAEDRMNGSEVLEAEVRDFKQFLTNNSLAELQSFGRDYTWTNGHVMSIIDRAIVNADWMTSMPNMQFLKLVEEKWQIPVNAVHLEGVWLRLKHVKQGLEQINMTEFARVTEKIANIRNNLRNIQAQMSDHNLVEELFQEEKALRTQLEDWSKVEESIYRQKSRIQWLKLGDSNSAYFHASMKSRIAQNHINSLTEQDGSIIQTPEGIKAEIINFYKQLLGSSSSSLPII
ncbi:uncharacterized protein LOC132601709 [Lycium barbarum]|uniref:uncharacterized protein LOC132601709 n=1 Tax=Lycium barbarum TaxID=112863 RepID=UPI00293EA1A9|nr:uncharacterized protein LOC132601709 [Lycium barbarum]